MFPEIRLAKKYQESLTTIEAIENQNLLIHSNGKKNKCLPENVVGSAVQLPHPPVLAQALGHEQQI